MLPVSRRLAFSEVPIIDLAPLTTQRCYHFAWFMYGWIEREHVLNLNACAAWWLQLMEPRWAARRR